jgi:hypothetical protein
MFTRLIMIAGLVVVAGILAIGALVSGDDDPNSVQTALPPESAIDEAPTSEPGGEPPLVTVTPAPTREAQRATQPPRPTQAPEPTAPPGRQSPTPEGLQPTPAAAQADFTGLWRILDTITRGTGAGESFAFDVVLQQHGVLITGGTEGIQITGRVDGQTATLTYRQPALGYTATFTLTLVDGMWGGGTFTSAVNAGTSTLHRLQ